MSAANANCSALRHKVKNERTRMAAEARPEIHGGRKETMVKREAPWEDQNYRRAKFPKVPELGRIVVAWHFGWYILRRAPRKKIWPSRPQLPLESTSPRNPHIAIETNRTSLPEATWKRVKQICVEAQGISPVSQSGELGSQRRRTKL